MSRGWESVTRTVHYPSDYSHVPAAARSDAQAVNACFLEHLAGASLGQESQGLRHT